MRGRDGVETFAGGEAGLDIGKHGVGKFEWPSARWAAGNHDFSPC